MKKIKRQNKLGTYLAVTAGVGCASSVANAAVTFYGINSKNDTNNNPVGITFSTNVYSERYLSTDGVATVFGQNGSTTFTTGTNLTPNSYTESGLYHGGPSGLSNGATLGVNNFAMISFNGKDGAYEAVGQFYFDATFNQGRLIAIATTNAVPNPQNLSAVGGSTLSISAGKAMIDAASVPEPSSLTLLALGSAGLIARRRRKAA